jgi:hypothetical protein
MVASSALHDADGTQEGGQRAFMSVVCVRLQASRCLIFDVRVTDLQRTVSW